jgi:hypothetical protein
LGSARHSGSALSLDPLSHTAVRRKYTVHAERADKLFKRLRAARLDHTPEDEMRTLHRIDVLIVHTWITLRYSSAWWQQWLYQTLTARVDQLRQQIQSRRR